MQAFPRLYIDFDPGLEITAREDCQEDGTLLQATSGLRAMGADAIGSWLATVRNKMVG